MNVENFGIRSQHLLAMCKTCTVGKGYNARHETMGWALRHLSASGQKSSTHGPAVPLSTATPST